MHKGLKLSINLELPKEPEYKSSLEERVTDAMERVEYGGDPAAYHFLRKVITCATRCHREGKRSEKLHKLLGLLTPFMASHAMEDWRGLDLVEGYVTNKDYKEDCDE